MEEQVDQFTYKKKPTYWICGRGVDQVLKHQIYIEMDHVLLEDVPYVVYVFLERGYSNIEIEGECDDNCT